MADEPDLKAELADAAEAMRRLSGDRGAFDELLKGFRAQQPDVFRDVLGRLDLIERCGVVCRWFCSKECVRLCLLLAGPPPSELAEIPDPAEFADVVGRVTSDDAALERLVKIVEAPDPDSFQALIKELQIERFRHLLCHWVCMVRCRLVCRIVCPRGDDRVLALRDELRSAGETIRKLAGDPRRFRAAVAAVQRQDCPGLQRVIASVGLADRCFVICEFFCSWQCIPVCVLLCGRFPLEQGEVSDEEVFAFAEITAKLGETPGALPRLLAAVERQDTAGFEALVKQFELQRFCIQLCHWLCFLLCRRFCFCVCPPLIGRIDTPAEGSCAEAAPVPGCSSASGPLVGIAITGSAGGAGFHHYTLRYSWGANPPIDDAVVYPDCSRPPATTSSTVPVAGGTLGYLDVFMLPAGQTGFTVYLDVFDSGAGHIADTQSFELRTQSVEITAVAKVDAFSAADPFHPATTTKLIKSTLDVAPTVPEVAVGGAFSVDGSAYVIGCNRLMTQFALVHYPAPPAAAVPNFPDASGGASIIAPVVYADTPNHPWVSGCIGSPSDNTIRNGNLVAVWSVVNCTFLGIPYTVPKVRGVPFFNSASLNGRFVILLEVRDRLLPAGPYPGDFAAKDQVVVWIDNRTPEAAIHTIGGITGCGDLHVKDFVGTTAHIEGIAWDPPIDPGAPQARPNDNFASYSLTFQKNGVATPAPAVTGTTPNTRVPAIWPGPLPPGASGQLADWDIVTALDIATSGPGDHKLARGERCAYVFALTVSDSTHVGDSGNNHQAGPVLYAINIINDIP